MPELPEVEVIRRQIYKIVKNRTIKKIEIMDSRVIKGITPAEFKKQLVGKKITELSRRAKYLIFNLSSGKILLVHLGMAGTLIIGDKGQKYNKYALGFEGGKVIYYCDSRMFGKTRILDNLEMLQNIGPEPLGGGLGREGFFNMLRKHKVKIKILLLNQAFLAGLGNIYACEALYYAGIHPKRKSDKITRRESDKLLEGIKKILSQSVKQGGSSVDRYVNASGEKGRMQNHLKVYGREGLPCERCGGKVKKINLGQRGTYYCPRCQK
jgi:formamidopyrimidine-DNA glycosylase